MSAPALLALLGLTLLGLLAGSFGALLGLGEHEGSDLFPTEGEG